MKIELKNISHRYHNSKLALKTVDLELKTGITGFLGVNGAGKSTLLNIIATAFKPSQGSYRFNDHDVIDNPFELRKVLGYLPQHIGFISGLSVQDYLIYISLLKGCDKAYVKKMMPFYLQCFNLEDQISNQIAHLSGGMKQRVGIIQSILTQPKILILDEPIIGLDPNERNNFNNIISELAQNTIVLISSHIIEDIENICEHVILLDNGNMMFNGKTSTILSSIQDLVHEKTITRDEYEKLDSKRKIIRMKPMGHGLKIRYISDYRIDQDWVEPNLEDAFIYKTKISG